MTCLGTYSKGFPDTRSNGHRSIMITFSVATYVIPMSRLASYQPEANSARNELCFSSIRVCWNLENMNAGKSYDSVDLVWNSGGYSLQVPLYPLFPCKKLRRNFPNAFFWGLWPNMSTFKLNESVLTRNWSWLWLNVFFTRWKLEIGPHVF